MFSIRPLLRARKSVRVINHNMGRTQNLSYKGKEQNSDTSVIPRMRIVFTVYMRRGTWSKPWQISRAQTTKIFYLLNEVADFTTTLQESPCYEVDTNPMSTVDNLLQRNGQEHLFTSHHFWVFFLHIQMEASIWLASSLRAAYCLVSSTRTFFASVIFSLQKLTLKSC